MPNETPTPIKVVQIGTDVHELLPKYIQDGTGAAKTWADIVAIASEAGLELKSEDELPEIPSGQEQAAAFYDLWKKRLVLIPSSNPGTQNIKDEYIIQRDGDGELVPFTYRWEQIGSTEVDLSNYVQKGVNYVGAAQSNGAHTHTVTVPTISVDKTKKLGATASGTDATLTKDTFVKSYPGTTSKMVTTTVKGVSGTTTASKATAGTDITLAKRAGSQTTVGNADVGTAVTVATKAASPTKVGNADVGDAVSIPNVTGNTSVTTTFVNTPQNTTITEVTGNTTGSAAAWSANVDGNGVLSFSFTANVPTAITTADVTNVIRSNASSGTIVENRTSSNTSLGTAISVTPAKAVGTGSTEIYGCGDNTSVTPAVASSTKIYGVGDTETITPYTFADVTVPVAAESATTVATGSLAANGSGASVMTGLGTAVTAQAVTDVAITDPTITITEDTTNTGPVNEHVTTSTASATTSSNGAHTHDINVASA